ncbi:MAG TPA: 3'(2'),5'-bisphosphate nucleotidase CysQ [Rhizomicrobium sp.]
MPAHNAADLQLVESAVREAGEIARRYFGRPYRRWSKNRGEPVTEADLAIDRFLHDTLEGNRPDYGWLSEETGREAKPQASRGFIVDPIDGTTAFLKERPHFSISVAVAERGRPVVGVVYNPILEELFSAMEGGGAHLNGAVIRVSGCAAIEGCRVLGSKTMFDQSPDQDGALVAWPAMQVESRSSIAYRMALVGSGRFDAAIVLSPKHDWDMAAGDIIVREAGGRCTSRNGSDLEFDGATAIQRSMICAGPLLHALLLERLGPADSDTTRA